MKTMTPRRTAEERIVERSAKARLEPNDFGVVASAIWIASAGISGFVGGCKPVRRFSRTQTVPTAKKGLAFGSKRSVCVDIPAAKALPGRPLAPAIALIRGSRR